MSDATQPSLPPSKGKIFFRRLFSSVVLWTIVIWALFSNNKLIADYVFLTIMVLLAGLGLIEFYGLVEKGELYCFPKWGITAGILLMVFTFLHLSGELGIHGTPSRVNDFETSF